MAFFIGTPDGQGGHDSTAEKIGENGQKWSKSFWRKADMAYAQSYFSDAGRD